MMISSNKHFRTENLLWTRHCTGNVISNTDARMTQRQLKSLRRTGGRLVFTDAGRNQYDKSPLVNHQQSHRHDFQEFITTSQIYELKQRDDAARKEESPVLSRLTLLSSIMSPPSCLVRSRCFSPICVYLPHHHDPPGDSNALPVHHRHIVAI